MRLKTGDPDLESDEILAAIERAEQKRLELVEMHPEVARSAKLLAVLPKAAEACRGQIEQGLEDDTEGRREGARDTPEALGACPTCPEAGGLWAEFEVRPAALLKASGSDGSGGSLPTLFSLGYSDGYSLERATLEDGQRADVRALTTFGAGCCIACQRS